MSSRDWELLIWAAPELAAEEFPAPEYVVDGLLPVGVSLLAGAPKVGKSWLGLQAAKAVANGRPILGRDTTAGSVLYLALEDSNRRMKHRVGPNPPPNLDIATSWDLLSDDGGLWLADYLTQKPDCRLIVVDTLEHIRPATQRSRWYAEDVAALKPLRDLCNFHGADQGLAVLVIHHLRKAPDNDYLNRISGSTGLTGAADTVLVLNRSRSAADATLHVTGRDVEEQRLALRFTGTGWDPLGDAERLELSETRRAILDVLEVGEWLPPKTIAERLEGRVKYDAVRQQVTRMADDGQLATREGTYALPETVTPVTPSLSDVSDSSDERDNQEESDISSSSDTLSQAEALIYAAFPLASEVAS